MIPIYSWVLSAIEKILWELVEEYREVRKFLWDLAKGQERNTAQLVKIGTIMEQRWGLEGENEKEKSGYDKEGSMNGLKEG